MEKVIIRKSEKSVTGYEMVTIDEEGNKKVTLLNDRPKNEPHTLILPENPSNRKYFSDIKVDKSPNCEVELTYKATIQIGNRISSDKKPWLEYLTDEERKLYDELKATGEARKAEAEKPKPKTELEKAQEALRKAQERLANLMKEGEAE